jgi:hypothetical protein
VAAILASTLKQDPASLNTDWFGALLVKGLLEWAPRGIPEARATGWLLWSITGVLRHLSPQDPHFEGFVRDLAVLARGVARAQNPAPPKAASARPTPAGPFPPSKASSKWTSAPWAGFPASSSAPPTNSPPPDSFFR